MNGTELRAVIAEDDRDGAVAPRPAIERVDQAADFAIGVAQHSMVAGLHRFVRRNDREIGRASNRVQFQVKADIAAGLV